MAVSHRGRVAAVFGASTGMGRATALALARNGARIAASARTESALKSLIAEIRAEGGEAEMFVADVQRSDEARASVERILKTFGEIDILVYSTGNNIPGRAVALLSEDDWEMMQRTNLWGLYYVVRAALPALRRSGARLVAVSSAAVQLPDASGVAYQTTKHAMVGFVHGLMKEEASNGVRATVIFPGPTKTGMIAKRPVPTPPEIVAQALEPEDVAEAVLYVTSLPQRAYVPELVLLPAAIQQR